VMVYGIVSVPIPTQADAADCGPRYANCGTATSRPLKHLGT
jgi:hypothetical protein